MRHSKRRSLIVLAGLAASTLGLTTFDRPARAAFLFDPDGGAAGNGTITVGGVVFSTGNALAKGAVAPGGALVSPFELYFQASVGGFTNTNGNALPVTGLNTAFELTVVLRATEVVLTQDPPPGAATFAAAAVQVAPFFEIYYDTAINSDPLAGTGYNDGQLILQGTPTPALRSDGSFTASAAPAGNPLDGFGSDDRSASDSVSGSGSATFGSIIDRTLAAFFPSDLTGLGFAFSSLNRVNFDQTNPSILFDGTRNTGALGTAGAAPAVPSVPGTINGTSGPDFQFQALANGTVVPEPASVTLMGLGLVGMVGGIGWRKKTRRA